MLWMQENCAILKLMWWGIAKYIRMQERCKPSD